MKIGKLVKLHLLQIFSHCEKVDHDEFHRLLDSQYSKEKFGTNFPFCKQVDLIDTLESKRYWTEVYVVRGERIRVTSQWFATSMPRFIAYLAAKRIAPQADLEELERSESSQKQIRKPRSSRANSRYRGWAIGNAQNLLVRNVLSRLGFESFSQRDWEATKEHFSNRCAYCGAEADHLLIEHAIAINKESLGEHRLGNLVPSCKECNTSKGDKDFREFLDGNDEAIARIETYMDSRNYVPLEDNEQVKMVLDMAHKEVAAVADRYVAILNELFVQGLSQSAEEPASPTPPEGRP